MTLILGIETTCDETAAAVVRDGSIILSNTIASQMELHRPYGGVVPELASRLHLDRIAEVVQEALDSASVTMEEIDRIAVATTPGLVGALLVGLNFAKGLALSFAKPLIGVNHIEAHLYAAMMGREEEVELPALGVVLSGGHTSLLHIEGSGRYAHISSTVDDAIGEAFDKVATLLGLPYPGGPEIEAAARRGDPSSFPLRAGQVKGLPLAFSFSGLKTSVLYALKGVTASSLTSSQICDMAASFQEAAFRDIQAKIHLALKRGGYQALLLGGGVTCNKALRARLSADPTLPPLFWPAGSLSLDNAAMIAGLAFQKSYDEEDLHGAHLSPQPTLKPFWQESP